jgi:hypothetical protein
MNADMQKILTETSRRNPFWICFVVFSLLAVEYGYRLATLLDQREQLNQAVLLQAQNAGTLAQARQLESRLESFSLDLLQVAKTNAAARQIVQDFNIQWTPRPGAAAPAPSAPAVPAPAPAAGAQPKK